MPFSSCWSNGSQSFLSSIFRPGTKFTCPVLSLARAGVPPKNPMASSTRARERILKSIVVRIGRPPRETVDGKESKLRAAGLLALQIGGRLVPVVVQMGQLDL